MQCLKIEWSAVFVATNFIVGCCTASAIVSASLKSFFWPLTYARTYLPASSGCHGQRGERAGEVMRADTGLHANQAGGHVGEPHLNLAARPFFAHARSNRVLSCPATWNEFLPIRCRPRRSGCLLSWAWAAPVDAAPCRRRSLGRAGARPDHPISGPARPTHIAMQQLPRPRHAKRWYRGCGLKS